MKKLKRCLNQRRLNMTIFNSKTLILSLFIIAFASSCKLGKKYQQPKISVPETYRGDWGGSSADSAFYSIKWRDLFNDPLLLELIDSGLVNNFDMRLALKNIEIAQRSLFNNKFEYLPSITANVGTVNKQYRSEDYYSNPSSNWYAEKGKTPPESMFVLQSQYSTGLNFGWEADVWGRIANQKDLLKAEWFNTHEVKNAIQTKLIADISTGYFNLLKLDAQIEVAKRNLRLNDSTLHIIRLQFEAGEITALAVQQTESQRLVAASLVPELEKAMILQENALRMLVGELPQGITRGNTLSEKIVNFKNDISLGSPIDIVRNRPDIKSAEYALIQANAEVNLAQIMRYPQLNLSAVFGVNAMLPQNWFNIPGALLGGVIGEISAPIFKNNKLKNKYELAKLEREKSEISFQRQVMEAVVEVSNTITSIDKQQEQLAFSKRSVANSRLAVKNASLLFKSGYATYLEVITAQSNALKAELELVELEQRQLNSFVNLYRALGGGWQ